MKAFYERFRDSVKPAPVVATTVDLFTTGVDIPSVHNVVSIKPMAFMEMTSDCENSNREISVFTL